MTVCVDLICEYETLFSIYFVLVMLCVREKMRCFVCIHGSKSDANGLRMVLCTCVYVDRETLFFIW